MLQEMQQIHCLARGLRSRFTSAISACPARRFTPPGHLARPKKPCIPHVPPWESPSPRPMIALWEESAAGLSDRKSPVYDTDTKKVRSPPPVRCRRDRLPAQHFGRTPPIARRCLPRLVCVGHYIDLV